MIYSTKLKNDDKRVSGTVKQAEESDSKTLSNPQTWYSLKTLSTNISSPLQAISYQLDTVFAAPNWHNISKRKGLQQLLSHFRHLYDQPELLWEDIEELLSYLTHPVDRQLLWFYPLSELLKEISKEPHTQQATLEKLCQMLGVQFHFYKNTVNDYGIVVTTSNPMIIGAHKRVCHSIASIAVVDEQWIMLSKDPVIAAKHNNVLDFGIARTDLKKPVTLEDIKRITSGDVKSKKDIARLNDAIRAKDYLQVAKLLESEKECFSRINVQSFIESDDLALILTMAMFSLDMRNQLLSEPQKYKHVVLPMLQVQKKIDADFNLEQWPSILEEFVPSILRTEGDSELHKAIRKGDSNRAVQLIKAGSDFYKANQAGNTPLHLASYFGMVVAIEEMISVVIENTNKKGWLQRPFADGLKINLKNHNGETPVHFAAQCPNSDVIKALLDEDRNPTNIQSRLLEIDVQGLTAVHHATNHSDDIVLEVVLAYIKRVNAKPVFGEGYIAVKTQDKRGLTALHIAALDKEHPQRAVKLIEMGADPFQDAQPQFKPTTKDQTVLQGPVTPFALALEVGHCDAIHAMLNLESVIARHPWIGTKYNALKTENSNGMNVPGVFAYYGRIDLLRPLVFNESSAALGQYIDSKGRVPIHLAAMQGKYDAFVALLEQSKIGLLQMRDSEGFTALHHASLNGHEKIVQKICQLSTDHDKENKELARNIATNGFIVNKLLLKAKKKLIDIQGDINLDETTNDGLTAYMLAGVKDKKPVISILEKYSVNRSSAISLVLRIINRENLEGLDAEQAQKQVKRDQANLARLASGFFASKFKEYTYQNSSEPNHSFQGNTLIHFCVLAVQYRHLRIILHPLSVKDRKNLCGRKNKAGKKAFDLATEAIAKLKQSINATRDKRVIAKLKHQLEELEKIHRLLVQLMPKELKKLSPKSLGEYKDNWRQDMRGELISTSGYQTASNLMYWGPMALKACEAIITKRYLWCAGEAIVGQYLGGDVLQTTERGVRFVQGYLPADEYQWLNTVADGLIAAGWVTQTVNRTVIEFMKQSFAYGGRLYFERGHEGGNYLNALNAQGFVLGLTEGIYHQFSNDINKSLGFSGIDTLLLPKQGGINGLTQKALTKANDLIAKGTSIDIKGAVKKRYQWAKRNVGGVVPAGDIFDDEFADKLKEDWALENQELESEYLGVAKILFEDSYDYGHAVQTGRQLQVLSHYVNTGVFLESTYHIFVNAAFLMQQNGDDPSELLYQLVTQSKLIRSIDMDEVSQDASNEKLRQLLEEIDYSDPHSTFEALKAAVSENHEPILLQDMEHQKTKIGEDVLKESVLLEAAQEMIDAVIDDPNRDVYERHRDVRFLVAFIYTGNIYGDEAEFLQGLEQAGLEPSSALADFYLNSYGYKVFGLGEDKDEDNQAALAKSLQEAIESNQPVSGVMKEFSETIAEQFVEQRLIHSDFAPVLSNESVLNTIQTGILPTIIASIGDPAQTDRTLRGVFDLVHGGYINEDNVGLIDTIKENLNKKGIDPAEALSQLLLSSKGYVDVGFNQETKARHSTDLQDVIRQAIENDIPLSEVLIGSEYVYPISKAGQEAFEAKYAHNTKDDITAASTMHYIINCAFDGFGGHQSNARNLVAESIANDIIRYKYPYYPDIGDKDTIEAERQQHFQTITNEKLKYFNSDKHKCENALYNYINQQLNGVVKVKPKWLKGPFTAFLSGEPGFGIQAHSGGGLSGGFNYLGQQPFTIFNTQSKQQNVSVVKPSLGVSNATSQIGIAEAKSILSDSVLFPFGKPQTFDAVMLGQSVQSKIDGLLPPSPVLDAMSYIDVAASHVEAKPDEPQIKSTGQQLAELNASPMVQMTLQQSTVRPLNLLEQLGYSSIGEVGELPGSARVFGLNSTIQSYLFGRALFAMESDKVVGFNVLKASEYAQRNLEQLFRLKMPEAIVDANDSAAFINKQMYNLLTNRRTILDDFADVVLAYGAEEYRRFQSKEELIAHQLIKAFSSLPYENQMRLLAQGTTNAMISTFPATLAGRAITATGDLAELGGHLVAAQRHYFRSDLKVYTNQFGLDTRKTALGVADASSFALLKNELNAKTFQSLVNPDGSLTMLAIDGANIITEGVNLTNPILRRNLSKLGNIEDWAKYTTQNFNTQLEILTANRPKNINGTVHFYMNSKTGEIYYDMDYKVVYDIKRKEYPSLVDMPSYVHIPTNQSKQPFTPVRQYIDELPSTWRKHRK